MKDCYAWSVCIDIDPICDCGQDRVVLQRYCHVYEVESEVVLSETDIVSIILDKMGGGTVGVNQLGYVVETEEEGRASETGR